MRRATLLIEGMRCGHCLSTVQQALSALPGVRIDTIRVGRADVSYDENSTDPGQLEAAVADAGYRATAQA